jgi:hypothetical protein
MENCETVMICEHTSHFVFIKVFRDESKPLMYQKPQPFQAEV